MNSRQWTVVFCVAVAVVLLCVTAPVVLFGGVIAAACSPATQPSTAATATGEPGRWDAEQVGHATTMVTVGAGMLVPPRGWVIAVATAMQESNLRNLGHLGAGNDHDSLGLFQQRPSQGWGTPEQVMDPRYAAGKFYEKLLAVSGWRSMSLTEAAQAVQRSAYPHAYARHEAAATVLVGSITGGMQACDGVGSGGWVMPVDGPIVSGFRTPERPGHDGIDIAAAKGTPIRAAATAVVIKVACNASLNGRPYPCDRDGSPQVAGCGWYTELKTANIVHRYCHQRVAPYVVVGQQVKIGQIIGVVGTSGHSSGPHLHWEVHDVSDGGEASSANALDPEVFLSDMGVTQPAEG